MALTSGRIPTSPQRPGFEPWPLVVVGMLAGMGVVLGLFLRTAVAHRDPIVVEDAYAAGLQLSSEIDAARRVVDRGWSLSLAASPEADGVRVRVTLGAASRSDAPPAADSVSVRRERLAEGGLDETFTLAPAEGGAFEGVVPLPRPGRWELVARADVDGDPVVRRFSVEAPR